MSEAISWTVAIGLIERLNRGKSGLRGSGRQVTPGS